MDLNFEGKRKLCFFCGLSPAKKFKVEFAYNRPVLVCNECLDRIGLDLIELVFSKVPKRQEIFKQPSYLEKMVLEKTKQLTLAEY